MLNYLRILFLVLVTQSVLAQSDNWRVVVGSGLPEFTYIGAGYKLTDQRLVSLTFGTAFPSESKVSSFTLKHAFLFKSSNKFDNLKTWFFGQKVNYLRKRPNNFKDDYAFIGLDIGRQFNISKKLGVAFDVGIVYLLLQPEDRDPTDILPTANLQLFYRF
jgi:hypothetical protein